MQSTRAREAQLRGRTSPTRTTVQFIEVFERTSRQITDRKFTAEAVRDWLGRVGVGTLFIEPDSPWVNGYVESFNGEVRDALLNGARGFYSLKEAKVLIE